MRFSFIHAADLHIDSPLAGLGLKDETVARRFADAGRRAVEALIDHTLATGAAFLVISGDIFDGDWKDVTTGYFFTRALGRLHREGVPTFIVHGNHDAESVMSKSLPYPDSVHIFSAAQAQTFVLEQQRVALHGRSFSSRNENETDFVTRYPQRLEGWLNIGVLHTALDGARGHKSYAPCTVEALRRFGYDYWALGHVHAAETVSRDPWIVYPGNLQGRSIRETGPKGAMCVTVEDGRVVAVEHVALDGARWAHVHVDVTDCPDEAAVLARIEAQLGAAHSQADGRPLAARLSLKGTTPLHGRLLATCEEMEEEARARGFAYAEDCWVEQIKIMTHAPARSRALAGEADALDLDALLRAAAAEPDYAATLAELTAQIADKLPRGLRDDFARDETTLAQRAEAARDRLLGELTADAS